MKIYLVGGAVRDKLLGVPIKEQDFVVVGATVADMLALGYKQVGKEFPVFLHPKTSAEYALARMERKVKPGYKGFEFDTSTHVTLEEDLIRRDLTINAMAYDLEKKAIIDPFGGQKDLQAKLLRHVSSAFAEDPVRILRVGRFLARLAKKGFKVHPETIALMQAMVERGEVNALVAERVWKELERALSEESPDQFFVVLEESGALKILFPKLTVKGRNALKAASELSTNSAVRFAVLLHDYAHLEKEQKTEIAALCQRYRAPNYYRQLAILTALHYKDALKARNDDPEQVLKFLNSIDVYRREKRFHDFLMAVSAIAKSLNQEFDKQWLEQTAQIVKQIDVQQFIKKGLSNNELASELYKARREKLTDWLAQTSRGKT